MGAERFIITTSVDGRSYRKIWKAGKPLKLGHPFNLRVCRTGNGVQIETLPSAAELQMGYAAQRRKFEFGDEVPHKGFDLKLRRGGRTEDSGLVVNILPAAGFAPVYETEHGQKSDPRLWGQHAYIAPEGASDPAFIFTCIGNVVQNFERLGAGFTGLHGGKAAFRIKRLKYGVFQIRALVADLEIRTPHRIFKLEKKAESTPLSESDLGQSVICAGSSSWYFARCPLTKLERTKTEKEDAETEWFRRAIQSAGIGFFTLMMIVATWPQAPKKIVQEIVETTVDSERPKEIVLLPPDPPKEEPRPEPTVKPVPQPKPLELKQPEPKPVEAKKPEPIKPKHERPKPNAEHAKKASAPAPVPAPRPVPAVKRPKVAQQPVPVKEKSEPSPEEKAKAEAAVRAEAARVAEAAKQAEVARLAEAQRQAEIRKTEEAKAKIGAALGFMATASSATAVKSGDYNKAGKEIAYAESSGTSELAKATGKSTAIGTLAKSGQGNGTIATRSGKQINGNALSGGQRGGGAVSGKVHGKVRVGRGPGDGSFGMGAAGVKVEGQGSISQSALEATMRRFLQKFQYCYERALLSDPVISGNAVLSWTIDMQGKPSSVSVVRSQLNNEGLHGCLGKEIKHISFPKPEGGAVIVKYPFNFSSSSL